MTCTEASKFGKEHGFPNYSRTAHSLANHPETSGVQRVPELQRLFLEADPKCLTKKFKSDKRKKSERYSARFTPQVASAINEYMRINHILTRQELVERAIQHELASIAYFGDGSDECGCGGRKDPYSICCYQCAQDAKKLVREFREGKSDFMHRKFPKGIPSFMMDYIDSLEESWQTI